VYDQRDYREQKQEMDKSAGYVEYQKCAGPTCQQNKKQD
jgi:hypothetical protein